MTYTLRTYAAVVAALVGLCTPVLAHDLGFAGLLSRSNSEDLPPLMVSAEKPLADAPLVLKSGTYYEIELISDGSAELAVSGPGFFRAIWIDEVVINDLEVRPYGIDSFEFDDEGVLEISFVAIKPGTYTLQTQASSIQVTIQ